MHNEDALEPLPEQQRLPCGQVVRLGIRLNGRDKYGHVDVPQIGDGIIKGPEDYPAIGATVRGRVLGYHSLQLRLSLRV